MRNRALLLAGVAFLAAPAGTVACSGCSGDATGVPGVIIDYSEAVNTTTTAVNAKACFGQTCQTAASDDSLGPRILIPLANKASGPATVSLTLTNSQGSVVLNTEDTVSVPAIADGEGCGQNLWQLSLTLKDGRLRVTSQIHLAPASPPTTPR
jgi:hypothetical protein